jgi:2-iminobutanoate/2-iminopropanoate deaminase
MTHRIAASYVFPKEREETMRRALFYVVALTVLIGFSKGLLAQSPAPVGTKAETPAPVRFVATDAAPKAIGPYSQAVVAGGFLYASGQIPIDPKTGNLVGGTIEQATERIFDNLEAVLKAAGLSFADVVKTTVYLTRVEDFAQMNGVYARRMGEHKPARSTVIVAALPKGAPAEIDLIASAKK